MDHSSFLDFFGLGGYYRFCNAVFSVSSLCYLFVISFSFGVDFSLYMCAAILYHLEPKILDHSVAGDLGEYLLVNSIEGFTVSGYFTFMMRLRDKYHSEFVSEATHNNVNLS